MLKKNHSIDDTYFLANKILALLFTLALIYPFSAKIFNSGLTCQYKMIYGLECRSCGLTRGLQSCLKFDFSTANKFNAQSTFIFIVIISQMIFRVSLKFIYKKTQFNNAYKINDIILFDVFIILSLLIFNLKHYG